MRAYLYLDLHILIDIYIVIYRYLCQNCSLHSTTKFCKYDDLIRLYLHLRILIDICNKCLLPVCCIYCCF